METLLLAIAGAAVGALVALFANLVVLPGVLRQRGQNIGPSEGAIRFVYRVAMPVLFVVVGAYSAVNLFGEHA